MVVKRRESRQLLVGGGVGTASGTDSNDHATMPSHFDTEKMVEKLNAPPLYTSDGGGGGGGAGSDTSEKGRRNRRRTLSMTTGNSNRNNSSFWSSWGRRRNKGSDHEDDDDYYSLPSWTPSLSNPQASEEDFIRTGSDGGETHHKQTTRLVFSAKKRKSTFSFALMAFCLVGLILYSNARSTMKIAMTEVSALVDFSEKLTLQMHKAERDVRRLERELAALDAMEQQREDMEEEKKILDQASAYANPKLVKEMTVIQRKLKYSANRADKLKEQVQQISKRDSILKYGPGPQKVEIELIFPGSHLDGPTTFVVEMAHIDLMPHSVYTFLEMVSSGLLNGCSFILNALHVIKAAPLPFDGSPATEKAQDFLETGLESVAFREYSPKYPHTKYTVGFAADGSPSFYINTEDNTEIHVGDPCFAKIISGFDTIRRLENSPTRNGIWYEHRIGIKSAKVLV